MFKNNYRERDEFGHQWSSNSWIDSLNTFPEGRNNFPHKKERFYNPHISHPDKEFGLSQYQMLQRSENETYDSLMNCKSLSMKNLHYPMGECKCYSFGSNDSWDSRYKTCLNIGDIVDMSQLFTLHSGKPMRDESGDYYNIGTSFRAGNNYYFMKYPANYVEGRDVSLDVEIMGIIPSRFTNHIGYFHTYGMTQNYLIFCEQPMAFDIDQMKHANRSHYSEFTKMMTGEKNQLHIVDKSTGRTMEITYVTDRPYNFFSFVNCYEEKSHVIVDVLGYDFEEYDTSFKTPYLL
ncbi:BCMO1 [Lepeophtheirus salmonis]|uniref:BCMO1 n=1 Tax=Lepeophtheirus salmonis TaxID=72036 RepID=A0A7R8CJI3_LEPSM|nr:BCMO1 [Lepeophtheirus salmonis]CAF2836828.1 BCMO1 [Lepeophtheirus salmonis]